MPPAGTLHLRAPRARSPHTGFGLLEGVRDTVAVRPGSPRGFSEGTGPCRPTLRAERSPKPPLSTHSPQGTRERTPGAITAIRAGGPTAPPEREVALLRPLIPSQPDKRSRLLLLGHTCPSCPECPASLSAVFTQSTGASPFLPFYVL